jgi:hypothetical protein
MFRGAGGIDLLTGLIKPVLDFVHFPSELLPMCLMRPLSGSGTLGLNLTDNSSIRDLGNSRLGRQNPSAAFANQTTIGTPSGPRAVVASRLVCRSRPDPSGPKR